MAGMFITFEGGEGSGKTTIIDALIAHLEALGHKVMRTREPGGVPIAEQIRGVILDCNNTAMCDETEALLYAAARMQHLHEKVIPALKDDYIVICDRYLDSSLVYQGIARGLGVSKVMNANAFALDYMPLITFFIDVCPKVGLKRLEGRSGKMDRLDKESIDFHDKVYNGYLSLLDMFKDRIVRVDGERDKDDVIKDCIDILTSHLGK